MDRYLQPLSFDDSVVLKDQAKCRQDATGCCIFGSIGKTRIEELEEKSQELIHNNEWLSKDLVWEIFVKQSPKKGHRCIIFGLKICNENLKKLSEGDENNTSISYMYITSDMISSKWKIINSDEQEQNKLKELSTGFIDKRTNLSTQATQKYFEKIGCFQIDLRIEHATFFPYLEIIQAASLRSSLYFGEINTTFSVIIKCAINIIQKYESNNGIGLVDANCHWFVWDMICKLHAITVLGRGIMIKMMADIFSICLVIQDENLKIWQPPIYIRPGLIGFMSWKLWKVDKRFDKSSFAIINNIVFINR